MAYEQILRRAFAIVRNNLYLIGLGVLVALSSSTSFGSNSNVTYSGNGSEGGEVSSGMPIGFPDFSAEQFQFDGLSFLAAGLVVGLLLFALLLGLIILAAGSTARGGLVASVNAIEEGQNSSFGDGWRAGWARFWTLLGINLLPALPILLGGLIILGTIGTTVGFASVFDTSTWRGAIFGTGVALSIGLLCILLPVALVLSLLRTFALRACMLEGRRVWDAYSRGWSVARANLGPAIIFFLIQIAISIVVGFLLFLPGIIAAFCCLLWPVFLLIQGAIAAYFSTVWTLVWRTWTVDAQLVPPQP